MLQRICLVVTIALAACARPERASLPRFDRAPVILISIDTLRADHLPLAGYRGVETPAIDALARDGVVFHNAWSHCPMTLPSHLSMLTGALPAEHAVRNNIGYRFDPAAHPSLPKLLAARGYATGAAVSAYVMRGDSGIAGAFDFYDDVTSPPPGAAFADYQRPGNVTEQVAERWIASHKSQPFFFMLHLYEPHVPYAPPEPFRSRYANAPYDGEIATADKIVGDFLDYLKREQLYDKAIIILTSDHGEGLGEHGEEQHSVLLYTATMRVPLVVKLPARTNAGRTEERNVQTIDIAPTILSALGADVPPAMHGSSLFALPKDERDIYGETIYPRVQLGWSDLASLVRGRMHLIDGSRPELYDAAADPHETKDLAGTDRRTLSAMREALAKLRTPVAPPQAVDAETARKLAALGYVGSLRTANGPLANPVDRIGDLARLRDALALPRRDAIAAIRAILANDPNAVDVWIKLAELQQADGDLKGAAASYAEAIGRGGILSSDTLAAAGNVQLLLGNRDAARASAALAIRSDAPAKGHELMTHVALAAGDFATAEAEARAAMATSHDDAAMRVLLAKVLVRRGDTKSAEPLLAGITQDVFGLHATRAEIFARTDRPEQAMAEYEKELAAYPSDLQAYAGLAFLQYLSGRRAETEKTMERMVAANPQRSAYMFAAQTYAAMEEMEAAERWRKRAMTVR